ncbi:MAG TPA: DUF58 domain-containing protein [Planctomycetes bacterium]|nr:DUF58 domain-containing protein [Planctomycetota bacterium]
MAAARNRLTELLDGAFMARLDALDIRSRRILRGGAHGERRSKRRGQSVEFADHRQYAPGDDIRFLDWNIYGRLDRFFLKVFLEEQDLSLHILLDASASVGFGDPPKRLLLRRLAAALAYIGLARNNRVTVATFADGLRARLSGMRGRAYLPALADLLLTAPDEGFSDFGKACRQLAQDRLGSGITVVLSDFLFKEGYERGFAALLSDRYDLCAVQVLSPQERAPDLAGDLKLVDAEDGDASEITATAALLARYRRTLDAYVGGLSAYLTRRGAAHLLADSSQPVDRLVLTSLRNARIVGA